MTCFTYQHTLSCHSHHSPSLPLSPVPTTSDHLCHHHDIDTHELQLPSENVYLAHRHTLRLSPFTCYCAIDPVLHYRTHCTVTQHQLPSFRAFWHIQHSHHTPYSLDSASCRFRTCVVDPTSSLRITLSLIQMLLLYLDVVRSFLFWSCISRFVTARLHPFRLN